MYRRLPTKATVQFHGLNAFVMTSRTISFCASNTKRQWSVDSESRGELINTEKIVIGLLGVKRCCFDRFFCDFSRCHVWIYWGRIRMLTEVLLVSSAKNNSLG